jgi:hypothetical protein
MQKTEVDLYVGRPKRRTGQPKLAVLDAVGQVLAAAVRHDDALTRRVERHVALRARQRVLEERCKRNALIRVGAAPLAIPRLQRGLVAERCPCEMQGFVGGGHVEARRRNSDGTAAHAQAAVARGAACWAERKLALVGVGAVAIDAGQAALRRAAANHVAGIRDGRAAVLIPCDAGEARPALLLKGGDCSEHEQYHASLRACARKASGFR